MCVFLMKGWRHNLFNYNMLSQCEATVKGNDKDITITWEGNRCRKDWTESMGEGTYSVGKERMDRVRNSFTHSLSLPLEHKVQRG